MKWACEKGKNVDEKRENFDRKKAPFFDQKSRFGVVIEKKRGEMMEKTEKRKKKKEIPLFSTLAFRRG